MNDLQGMQFSPGLQQRFRQSLNSPTGASANPLPQQVSQALQVLSLHLPGNLGGNPIAPDALLRPSHSFTPDAAVRSQVTGSMAPPSAAPTMPSASAPSDPGTPFSVSSFSNPIPSSSAPPSATPPSSFMGGPPPSSAMPSFMAPQQQPQPFSQPSIDQGPQASYGGSAPAPNITYTPPGQQGVTDQPPPPQQPPSGGQNGGLLGLLDSLLRGGGGGFGGGDAGVNDRMV